MVQYLDVLLLFYDVPKDIMTHEIVDTTIALPQKKISYFHHIQFRFRLGHNMFPRDRQSIASLCHKSIKLIGFLIVGLAVFSTTFQSIILWFNVHSTIFKLFCLHSLIR